MSQKKKAQEKEILRRMLDDPSAQTDNNDGFHVPPEHESLKEKGKRMFDNQPDAGSYHPLTLDQTKKIKLILYPIVLLIAIVVYLIVKGYIH